MGAMSDYLIECEQDADSYHVKCGTCRARYGEDCECGTCPKCGEFSTSYRWQSGWCTKCGYRERPDDKARPSPAAGTRLALRVSPCQNDFAIPPGVLPDDPSW